MTAKYLAAAFAALAAFSTASAQPKEPSPPGELISFAGRKVHLFCEGSGSPTAVIEAGGETPARLWRSIQDKIARSVRVCAYDRAGYGWSDPELRPRSLLDRAQELHAVLTSAGERGPYILLAHSYGGLLARLFAREHPHDVVGMVLVDAAEEGVDFAPGVLEHWRTLVPEVQANIDKAKQDNAAIRVQFWLSAQDEVRSILDTPNSMRQPGGFGTLGNIPLIVIAHGQPFTGEDAVLEPLWRDGQQRLVGLSTQGQLVVAQNSGHNIWMIEPDLIVDAVNKVRVKAQDRRKRR